MPGLDSLALAPSLGKGGGGGGAGIDPPEPGGISEDGTTVGVSGGRIAPPIAGGGGGGGGTAPPLPGGFGGEEIGRAHV